MSVLHQMVPMFFLIQFVVVLLALVVSMFFADSKFPSQPESLAVAPRRMSMTVQETEPYGPTEF